MRRWRRIHMLVDARVVRAAGLRRRPRDIDTGAGGVCLNSFYGARTSGRAPGRETPRVADRVGLASDLNSLVITFLRRRLRANYLGLQAVIYSQASRLITRLLPLLTTRRCSSANKTAEE